MPRPRVFPSGSPGSGEECSCPLETSDRTDESRDRDRVLARSGALQKSLIADRPKASGTDGREVRSQTLGDLECQLRKRPDLILSQLLDQVTAWRRRAMSRLT